MKRKRMNESKAKASLGEDLIVGAGRIGEEIGASKRRAYHLLETGALPAFKLGGIWHLRRSTMLNYVAALEKRADSFDLIGSS